MSGAAKAWVNFNGTGTVAIRASFNVTSITDNGTGDYTVNFTNALEDANYSISGIASYNNVDTSSASSGRYISAPQGVNSTTQLRFTTVYAYNTVQDCAGVCIQIFR